MGTVCYWETLQPLPQRELLEATHAAVGVPAPGAARRGEDTRAGPCGMNVGVAAVSHV